MLTDLWIPYRENVAHGQRRALEHTYTHTTETGTKNVRNLKKI